MTLRHAGSVDFCLQSVTADDCKELNREWPPEPVTVRTNRVIHERTTTSQVSCVTIGGQHQPQSTYDAQQFGDAVLKEMVEKRLSHAVQTLAKQHQQTLALIDEFCRSGFTPTPGVTPTSKLDSLAELAISVPGTVEQHHPPRPPTNGNRKCTESSDHTISSQPALKSCLSSKTGDLSPDLVRCRSSKELNFNMQSALMLPASSSRPVTASAVSEAWTVTDVGERDLLLMPRTSLHSQQGRQHRRVTIAAAEHASLIVREKSGSFPYTSSPSTTFNRNSMFADVSAMKAKIKQSVMKPEYKVEDRYDEKGFFQSIARSSAFENLTLAIITINSIWIAIDTDYNKAPSVFQSHPIFIAGENFFGVYFCTELVIRFMAFASKADAMRDGWFVFDTLLVLMMVFELWIMNLVVLVSSKDDSEDSGLGNASMFRLVRVLRLTRMARMARLLRVMPELMILIKGISAATRSVFFTLCLLAILIYVFGIAFTQLTQDTALGEEYFESVPNSMATLLLRGTLPDLADFVNDTGREHILLAVLMMFFILFSVLTVMNMLVGVLVEVVSVVSEVEKEKMTVNFVRTELLSMLKDSGLDQDGDHQISRNEFEALLTNPSAARIIQEVGVDVVGLVDYSDHIFKNEEDVLTFPHFMDAVLQLRGTNKATVKDMVDLRKFISNNLSDFADRIEEVSGNLSEVKREMSSHTRGSKERQSDADLVFSHPKSEPRAIDQTAIECIDCIEV